MFPGPENENLGSGRKKKKERGKKSILNAMKKKAETNNVDSHNVQFISLVPRLSSYRSLAVAFFGGKGAEGKMEVQKSLPWYPPPFKQ